MCDNTIATFLGAFSNLRHNIEEVAAKENKIVERWTDTGTPRGEF